MVWASGQQLQGGKYVIEQVLGQGGFGITYKAHHTMLNAFVVIKTPNDDLKNDPEYPKFIKRFREEGQRLEKLSETQHPNIVRVRDLFHEGGTYCLVMDFVQGDSLFNLIQKTGALPAEEAVKYISQIGDALKIVHQAGLVHRDAHPGNIMVQQDGKAVLIDFGIAGETIPKTVSSKVFANPAFAPYEQMRGDRKPSVDIYSLAASLYYAVTGKFPEAAINRRLYSMELVSPQQHISSISNELNQAILKGMELEPENRPQTMQEWLESLKEPPVIVVAPINNNSQINNNPQVNNNQQTLIKPSRRKFIQTVAWMGVGLGVTVTVGKLITDASRKQSTSVQELSLQTFNFETVTVDAKGTITNRRNGEAKYFVEDLGNGVTLEMVQIPEGTFKMGSPEGEVGRDKDESPQQQVTVPEFFMGRYEVTQAQYQAIMGTIPANFKDEKLPVEQASWNDAVEFCQKLSQKTGRTYRLPSEAEWEYACRAETTTPFYFGETITPDLVSHNANHPGITSVGSFPPNAFGLYDMHGNVSEWCQDDYHDNYNGVPTDGRAWVSNNTNFRLLRGGSWASNPFDCRSASRSRSNALRAERNVILVAFGFRVVCVVGRILQ